MTRPTSELFEYDRSTEQFLNSSGQPLTDQMREEARLVSPRYLGGWRFLLVEWE